MIILRENTFKLLKINIAIIVSTLQHFRNIKKGEAAKVCLMNRVLIDARTHMRTAEGEGEGERRMMKGGWEGEDETSKPDR